MLIEFLCHGVLAMKQLVQTSLFLSEKDAAKITLPNLSNCKFFPNYTIQQSPNFRYCFAKTIRHLLRILKLSGDPVVLGVVDSIAVTCFAVAINKWYFHLPCDPNFDAKTCREKIKIFLSNQGFLYGEVKQIGSITKIQKFL